MTFLSVIIPAFNEQDNLPVTVSILQARLKSLVPSHEIIIVDDASVDKTGEAADDLTRISTDVRAFHHSHNSGIGRAFVTGIRNARGEWVMLVPADLAMDVNDLHKYFDASRDCDVVVGLASDRSDSTLGRRIVSFVNIRAVQLLFGMHERQFQYICLYRMQIFHSMQIEYADSAFFHAEILIKAKALGYRLNEVVIGYSPRRAGRATGARPKTIMITSLNLISFWIRWVTKGKRKASYSPGRWNQQ